MNFWLTKAITIASIEREQDGYDWNLVPEPFVWGNEMMSNYRQGRQSYDRHCHAYGHNSGQAL